MPALLVKGASAKPLLVALHGLGQRVRSWLPRRLWPWGLDWDFARESQLGPTCESLGWSLWMPQSPLRDWSRITDGWAAHQVEVGCERTGCTGPLILAGFSDGATAVHRVAPLVEPRGLLAYSGLFSGLPDTPMSLSCRVAIITDDGELTELQEAGNRAEACYRARGHAVRRWVASLGRHGWDQSLNREMLEWLAG